MIQIHEHIFQVGWFNHQLVPYYIQRGPVRMKPTLCIGSGPFFGTGVWCQSMAAALRTPQRLHQRLAPDVSKTGDSDATFRYPTVARMINMHSWREKSERNRAHENIKSIKPPQSNQMRPTLYDGFPCMMSAYPHGPSLEYSFSCKACSVRFSFENCGKYNFVFIHQNRKHLANRA